MRGCVRLWKEREGGERDNETVGERERIKCGLMKRERE
jgi:hypothetical protein